MAETRSEGFAMEELRWQYRPLLIFAPSREDPGYRKQVEKLDGHLEGIEDRDMVLLHLFQEEGLLATPEEGECRIRELGAAETEKLRSRYRGRAEAFSVVLVGKDGGSKLDSSEPLEAETLFERIDAMPMRQSEMRSSEE